VNELKKRKDATQYTNLAVINEDEVWVWCCLIGRGTGLK
jgi:hypothetical protein